VTGTVPAHAFREVSPMKILAVILVAALGATALPAASDAGSSDQQKVKLVYNAKTHKYCVSMPVTGQILPVRDCRTKQEWIEAGAKISDASPSTNLAQK
jgi:hypothetical protein